MKIRISTKRKMFKKNQLLIFELKNIPELKNLIEEFNVRLDRAEERISKLEDI